MAERRKKESAVVVAKAQRARCVQATENGDTLRTYSGGERDGLSAAMRAQGPVFFQFCAEDSPLTRARIWLLRF